MPNLPISQLPQSTTLTGDELFVNVQDGVTKYTTLNSITTHQAAHISLYSSQEQTLTASGSMQPVTFTDVWTNSDIELQDSSKLVMAEQGVYQFNFVAQVSNPDNAVHDSWFWIKYNGENFPNSATQVTLQARKNASEPSAQLMHMSIIGQNIVDNGYIQLYWTANNALIKLRETPRTDGRPETPSVIASISRLG